MIEIRELLIHRVSTNVAIRSLHFDVGAYQREMGFHTNFFPEVRITFNVKDTEDHYHIPLLLSPFGYSTYRGT